MWGVYLLPSPVRSLYVGCRQAGTKYEIRNTSTARPSSKQRNNGIAQHVPSTCRGGGRWTVTGMGVRSGTRERRQLAGCGCVGAASR